MKWFLIFLAIGLSTSEKLDRTYLPPPGAEFAGGHPGDIQGPLELPNLPSHSPQPVGTHVIGPNGQPTQAPVTTTSYAFTQTTTYPPVEGFETTVLPINPVTGLPVQNVVQPGTITESGYQQYNQNLPYNQIQDNGASGYNLPGLVPQGPISNSQPINIGNSKYTQPVTSTLNQHPDQNIVIPTSQQPHQQQYGGDIPNSPFLNQYPGKNVKVPGAIVQLPGSEVQFPGINQGSERYPVAQIIPGHQEYITTTAIPQGGNQFLPERQYTTSGPQGNLAGNVPQAGYTGQPIILQETDQPEYTKGYQNQGQPILNGSPQQQHNSVVSPGLISGQNIYQPGQNYNNIPSSTPFPSSTSVYASVGPNHHPERPQAASDRNAVILNYENVRTPNGYAYSYDTSNGIHADESGTVRDGTQAQGSYSYTGDDGKIYSVIYTADENGFQPRGDHLPTPPPIPEAIKKVIEQAARDKEAGIIHDGSYDEEKYGYKNYQGPHRKIQTQNGKFKPISGITDDEYDEGILKDQLNYLDISGNNIGSPKMYASKSPSNKISDTGDNNSFEPDENRRLLVADAGNVPFTGVDNSQDKQAAHHRHPFDRVTNTKQPGTHIEDIDETYYYPDNEDGLATDFDDDNKEIENYKMESDRADQGSTSPDSHQIKNTELVTEQKTKYGRPGFSGNKYLKEKHPQAGPVFNQGDIDDFDRVDKEIPARAHKGQSKNPKTPSHITEQQINTDRYEYNTPQNRFSQTQVPSRFKGSSSLTLKPMHHKTFGKGTTLRPFLTPEVYNQPSGNRRGQDVDRQSGAREPFMTSRVITPKDTSFTDYDEDEDYSTDQDIGTNEYTTTFSPTRRVNSGSSSNKPLNEAKPTSSGQRSHTQLRTKIPGKINVTPTHVADTTSTKPSSRFESTGAPRRRPQHQRRPSNVSNQPDSSTAVRRPISSKTSKPEITDSYSTVRPSSRYPSTTIAPSYSTTEMVYNSPLPSGYRGPTSQTFPTSYRPVSPTIGPISSEYQPVNSGAIQIGNQYEPFRAGYSTTGRPQQSNEYYVPGTSTLSPGYYQTTNGQGPIDNSGTIDKASSGRPGTFILSQSTTASPESIPIDHSGYHYIRPANTFTHNVISSTPIYGTNFTTPNFPGNHRFHVPQTTPSGYEYGTSGPVYSTTLAPSTVGTTPGSIISSTTPGYVSHGYPTTQPSYPSTQGVYGQNPVVDGFGRPIILEQQPGFSYLDQGAGQYPGSKMIGGELLNTIPGGGPTEPMSTMSSAVVSGGLSPQYVSTQSPSYPGYYDQPKVIGEDFSGPKQLQKFDPQTGYYYK